MVVWAHAELLSGSPRGYIANLVISIPCLSDGFRLANYIYIFSMYVLIM